MQEEGEEEEGEKKISLRVSETDFPRRQYFLGPSHSSHQSGGSNVEHLLTNHRPFNRLYNGFSILD